MEDLQVIPQQEEAQLAANRAFRSISPKPIPF